MEGPERQANGELSCSVVVFTAFDPSGRFFEDGTGDLEPLRRVLTLHKNQLVPCAARPWNGRPRQRLLACPCSVAGSQSTELPGAQATWEE